MTTLGLARSIYFGFDGSIAAKKWIHYKSLGPELAGTDLQVLSLRGFDVNISHLFDTVYLMGIGVAPVSKHWSVPFAAIMNGMTHPIPMLLLSSGYPGARSLLSTSLNFRFVRRSTVHARFMAH